MTLEHQERHEMATSFRLSAAGNRLVEAVTERVLRRVQAFLAENNGHRIICSTVTTRIQGSHQTSALGGTHQMRKN